MKTYHTLHDKYHYWRGFRSGALLITLLVSVLILLACLLIPKPDYTMTPDQYEALKAALLTQSAQTPTEPKKTLVLTPKTPTQTAKTPPITRKSPTVHPEEMHLNTTCYSASNPVPAGVYNPCFIHADGTKTGGAGSYGGTQ